jgi:PmbA protein
VFVGQRQANIRSTNLEADTLERLVEDVVAMANLAPEDPHAGLANPDQVAKGNDSFLDLYDDTRPDAESLRKMAWEAEKAALSEAGITNSEGGAASAGHATRHHYATNGIATQSFHSSFSVSASVLAGSGTAMERDYDYDMKRHFGDLMDPELIGKEAARLATQRLGAVKPPSGKMPVIYVPRAARSLIGHLLQAINGQSVARGSSFLRDDLGKSIMPAHVTIIDDPLVKRGLSSRAHDGEGLQAEALTLVEEGILKTWLLDLASARQLGTNSNARAGHTMASPPSPSSSNIEVLAGNRSLAEMIAAQDQALLVTELIGMGVNGVTGDYSRGAAGFMIRHGEIAEPVSELTIAGNLRDMFAHLEATTDRDGRGSMAVGAIHVGELTIAGG